MRRKLRRALQPISMSLYALSKSPEYHGATTSDLQKIETNILLHLKIVFKIIKYYIDKFAV